MVEDSDERHFKLARVMDLGNAPLGLDVILKQTCQSSQMFFHLSDVMPKFFLNILYNIDSSFQPISHIYS